MDRNADRHVALRQVADEQVEWSDDRGVSGGFTGMDGIRLDPWMLVALYELRTRNLLQVKGTAVLTTSAGADRLRRWDTAQLARWS